MKLAERLAAARGGPIDWHGQTAVMMHDVGGLRDTDRINLEILHVSEERPQALRLKVRGGRVSVGDERLDDVILWSDTAPRTVVLTVHAPSERPCSLRMWNSWRDPDGVMQAWIGNAGMVVDPQGDDELILRCSDGFGDAGFTDLVVAVRLAH